MAAPRFGSALFGLPARRTDEPELEAKTTNPIVRL